MYSNYAREVIASYPSGMRVYRDLISSETNDVAKVLHLGCGRDLGEILALFPPSTLVVGLDPDAEAIASYAGKGHVGDGEDMPFENMEFDLVFSEMVLEHLDNPRGVFAEVSRVLKPGGRFISVTPNFFSYKSLFAAVTPHWFHRLAVRVLRCDSPRAEGDVYPTFYRANTKKAVQRLAAASGLTIEQFLYIDNGPAWFQRLPGVFELGRLFHAALRWRMLQSLRCNIVVVLRKPDRGN